MTTPPPVKKPSRKTARLTPKLVASRKQSGAIFKQAWSDRPAGKTGRLSGQELKAARIALNLPVGEGPGGGSTTH